MFTAYPYTRSRVEDGAKRVDPEQDLHVSAQAIWQPENRGEIHPNSGDVCQQLIGVAEIDVERCKYKGQTKSSEPGTDQDEWNP